MKIVFFVILISIQCLVKVQAQNYKYFNVEIPFAGYVDMEPVSNEERPYTEKGTLVYPAEHIGEYVSEVVRIMKKAISDEIISNISEKDKEKISIIFYFDSLGKVFKMKMIMPDNILDCTTEEQWNIFCNQFMAINVLKYIEVSDYDKKSFVHAMLTMRPYAYLKKHPELLND